MFNLHYSWRLSQEWTLPQRHQSFTKGSEFAYCWALWNMLPSQIQFFPVIIYWNSLSNMVFSLICHMGFRPQVVFALIYIFTIDIMLTELAKQHITWIIEVIWKLLIAVFWGKWRVLLFFLLVGSLLLTQAATLSCWHCLGGERERLWNF